MIQASETISLVYITYQRSLIHVVWSPPLLAAAASVCGSVFISCDVCVSLAASPPRFVSVEELMETAKGVTNLALAHEIVVNGSFQVKPTQPAEGR